MTYVYMDSEPVRDKKYIFKRSLYKSLQITNTAKYHVDTEVLGLQPGNGQSSLLRYIDYLWYRNFA